MSMFAKKKHLVKDLENNLISIEKEYAKYRVIGILEEDYRTLNKREEVSVRYVPEIQQCVVCARNRDKNDPNAIWTTSKIKRVGIKSTEWRRDGHLLTVDTMNSTIVVRIPEEEYEKASNIIEAFTKSMIA